jgi:hypothetical protein
MSKDLMFGLFLCGSLGRERTQTLKETFDLLLHTHFVGSGSVKEEVSSNFRRTTRPDCRVA